MPTDENKYARNSPPAKTVRRVTYLAVGTVLLLIGIMMGRALQNASHGYHYKLLEQKEYASGLGPIEWTHFLESDGTPLFDLDKTMISMGNRTIYKAQREFQEDAPYARNIMTSGNSISWDDGDYAYHLTVEEIKKANPAAKQISRPPSTPRPSRGQLGDRRPPGAPSAELTHSAAGHGRKFS